MEDDSSSADHLTVPSLDLSNIPPIGTFSAHFKGDEEDVLKATLRRHGAPLTADVSKVKVFIGKVGTVRRAEFELRARGFQVSAAREAKREASPVKQDDVPRKRRRVSGTAGEHIEIQDGSTTEEEKDEVPETEDEVPNGKGHTPTTSPVIADEHRAVSSPVFDTSSPDDIVWVVKVDWLHQCLSAGTLVPLGDNLVYKGKVNKRPAASVDTSYLSTKASLKPLPHPASHARLATRPQPAPDILNRAKQDATSTPAKHPSTSQRSDHHGSSRFSGRAFASSASSASVPSFTHQTAHLLQQTTSEYEGEDSDLPPPPSWVKDNIKYACQRFTPANPPNEDFIAQLRTIRTARTLIDDEIGVRAYSSIIASIAAYPYKLTHPREIVRLPNCDEKAATLFVEWKNTGKIQAIEDFENDDAMKVLRGFYDIWGVGAKTARHFYYAKGWVDLDDIIEYGWASLDRVQQIGVKYYDEFKQLIPRAEVERIADVVRTHAVRLRDARISATIVGGYRRGKQECGDVDLIISHPDLAATAHLVGEIVQSLEDEGWISHTLTLSLNNTARGQTTLPFRTSKASGAGFDTLDKALVVWQDPSYDADAHAKNPNIHRRVDIIISPWRTVGCAVMGWSGGTTFQRDLRRYAKHVKGWKFDSSGVRSRETGEVVMLEGDDGVSGTPEDAERKVFEGLRLEYVPPEMRCTN